MNQITTLFVSTFTTLLAIINPLESLSVFLKLLEGSLDRAAKSPGPLLCTLSFS
jgi:small neutral amino acid transporter SnatA (MarC family)